MLKANTSAGGGARHVPALFACLAVALAAGWGEGVPVGEGQGPRPPVAAALSLELPLGLVAMGLFPRGSLGRRRRLHGTLSKSERLALFQEGPEGGFVLEAGRFVLANRAAGALFGCDPEELIGRTPWEVSPPRQADGRSSQEAAAAYLAETVAGHAARFSWRHRRFDGTEFDCEVSLSVLPGPRRRVLAWVRDVTEERRRREELAATSERLRLLVEGTPAFFFYTQDLAGRVTYVSPSVEQITGRTVAEWLAQRHWFTTDNPINEVAREATRRHLAGEFDGEPAIVEIRHPDGHAVVLEAYEFGCYRDSVLVGLQGIAQDITARRRTEEALRESERTLATLMANLPGMAYRCRNDANWTMEFVSEGCRDLTGYATGEVLLNRVVAYGELIHPEDAPAVWRDVQQALNERRPFELNYRIRTASGEEKWVWERGRGVFDEGGQLRWLEGFITDVTDRRRAEASARFQASLLAQVRNAVVATDEAGNIVYWNRYATQLLGWQPEEVLGRRLIDVVEPLRRSGLRRQVVTSLLGSGHWEGETELRRRDGGKVWVEVVGSALTDARGSVSGFVAVASDITARRRAEKVRNAAFRIAQETVFARSLEEFFPVVHRIVAELLPAENFYIALHDAATGTLYFPYFVDQLDEPPAPRALGRGLTEYVLRSGQAVLTSPEVFADLVARGEVELLGPPAVDWLGVPLRVQETTIGVLAVQSYTEGVRYSEEDKAILEFVSTQVALAIDHVRAEQAVRQSEERYRRLVELSPDGIAVHCDGKVMFVNRKGLELLGYTSPEEVLGRPALDFVHPDSRPVVVARIRQLLAGGGPVPPVEETFLKADGSCLEVEVTATALTYQGKPAVQLVYRDISQRKAMEARLLQAQKQEAIGRLAGGIAHDFNNLLQAMMSTLHRCRPKGQEEGQIGAAVSELEAQIRRGASLARQLLLFARREVARPTVLDLTSVVRSACALVERLVPDNVHLWVEGSDQPVPVLADGGQIEQIVINLVVNAIDAMPDGGRVEVRTGARAGEAWLSVRDTGIGMDEQVQRRIFDPFFTTKGGEERSGLGLAVVQGIVERHGGRIEVSSAPGAGSTFLVVFPMSELPVPSQAPLETERGGEELPGRGEKVLLVEDEAEVRESLREALEGLGFVVTAVADGESALQVAESEEFAVLLTDLILPGMHGGELARALVQRFPRLGVVVMSGFTEDEAVKRGAREGRLRFLQKPFAVEVLARELRAALDEG
ncbi:MAG: PAS domain S-box protein [Thermoanaerobaculaceae bacterium]|nr:PAS domain S-box protein [Thermoanaerobaculaceae bacterium]